MTQSYGQCSGVVCALFFLIRLQQHSNCQSLTVEAENIGRRRALHWRSRGCLGCGPLLGVLATAWTTALESKLVRISLQTLSFPAMRAASLCFFFFFSPSICLLPRRGSCSTCRAPALEWALAHDWPGTVVLEIRRSPQTPDACYHSAPLLADPAGAFRGTWGHLSPQGASHHGICLNRTQYVLSLWTW